jgi:ubiquinone/menaquinone biosynthesis methyltransferase
MAHVPPEGGAAKARFVRAMFDAIAQRYDLMNRLMTGWQDERWRRLAADAVHPETVRVALDVGAGTGDLAFALAGAAPHARVIAADFAPGMLALAAQKRARSHARRHVQPLQGDAMRLPLAGDAVDAVVTGFTLRNVASLPVVFGELARVLRPGGRLAILELTPVRQAPVPGFARLFDVYFDHVVPVLGAVVSGSGFAYRYLPNSVKAFPDAERLSGLLREAGLEQVAYRRLALGTVALHTAVKPGAAPRRQAPATTAEALSVRSVQDGAEWNRLLSQVPNAHLLQCWEWGELKRETNWTPQRLLFSRAGAPVAAAAVSRRPLPGLGWGIAYCQKGPALDYDDLDLFGQVLRSLADYARRRRCIFLKVDPDVEATHGGAAALRAAGFVPAAEQVQTRSTVIVDLRGADRELLGRMSASWRRYINKAGREGVRVRRGTLDDLPRFFELMQDTERRQGYVIRPAWYYHSAFKRLHEAGLAELFLGEVEGSPEAAVVGCRLGRRAWYLWGGATELGLKARAPHLLQWQTMQWARTHGCDSYDMWGAPDDPDDTADPLSGVYYFKRGFGGRHVRMAGVYDYIVSPLLYRLWEQALPRYIGMLRAMRGERAGGRGAHDGGPPVGGHA